MTPSTNQLAPPRGNAIIGQSGGPTAVINQSLVGVIEGLRMGLHAAGLVKRIYGMRHGVRGLTSGNDNDLYDFTHTHHDQLIRLANTPSACLGSTRDKPDQPYCERILMRARSTTSATSSTSAATIRPTPAESSTRWPSARGLICAAFTCQRPLIMTWWRTITVRAFPPQRDMSRWRAWRIFWTTSACLGIKINVIMGRQAGFLTAASALARRRDFDAPLESTDGPQLIYLPEVPFDMEQFIADIDCIYSKKKRCHIAVSEGIRDKHGKEIGAQLISGAQVDAHGNVQLSGSGALGDALADFVKTKLTPVGGKSPRVRADTFGYVQRCWPDPSMIDQREARRSGAFAAQLAMAGQRSGSITILRRSSPKLNDPTPDPYISDYGCVELKAVAGKTRKMPAEFINGRNNVSLQFLEYCLPLVDELPGFERL